MRCLVTGGAGFVGSHLVDRLLNEGHDVVCYDDFSTGQPEFIERATRSTSFRLIRADVLDLAALSEASRGCEIVYHLAANADVRFGTQHPRKDLEQNTIGTSNVLESMRQRGVRRVVFASTGSVYGEAKVIPTPEDAPFPVQTSLYAASKLAAEALIQAYCEGFGFEATIFRFVSILGERYSHGHVIDFYRQLREHPEVLYVLGEGTQRKSYLYVQDCVDAMLWALRSPGEKSRIFNLGTDEYCDVNQSIAWICESLGFSPRRVYSGGDRGWIGDNPFIFLDCSRIRATGWRPRLRIRQAIERTLAYLQREPWLLGRRP